MASSPQFNFKTAYCSSCGKEVVGSYCGYCEEEVEELPSLDEYDVFDDVDEDEQSPE